jgi:acyl-CoA synthetase (AMP-forming)/AMP-acid ligase II/acyl carrier protein
MADTNIVSFLAAHACAVPGRQAFVILSNEEDATQNITWEELYIQVKKLAFQLSERQLDNKTVLLVYQDMMAFIISFLACQYAGVIAVPVPYARGDKHVQRINGIIKDAAANTILCTSATVNSLREELNSSDDARQFIATDGQVSALPENYLPQYNNISFIQYTSGSVGIPKGVVVTSRSLLHNQQLIQQTFGCDEQSVIFSWLPFHHDMGLIGNFLHTIYIGCTCILMSPLHFIQKPKAWLKGITAYKVTHSGAPNFAYDLCVDRISSDELGTIDLSSWKVAFNGSEPVQAATLQRFARHFQSAGFDAAAFMPCYGLAEATLLVSGTKTDLLPRTLCIDKTASETGKIQLCEQYSEDTRFVVSSGKPAAGMLVKIISLTDQLECGDLEEGEICIAGESVTSGYWNRDNSELFYELEGTSFLRTGDLGFLYEGLLFVHGRVKEMLIVRGKNYYPYDIEQLVAGSHEAIESNGVAVFSVGDTDAVVVVAEFRRAYVHNADSEAIISLIDQILNGHFGIDPQDIVLTTPLGIPRTTSGKLQRIKCRSHYQHKVFNVIASKAGMAGRRLKNEPDPQLLSLLIHEPTYINIRNYLVDLISVKNAMELPDNLQDDTDLTTLGVDSLRSMEIINIVNQELNIQLDATKLYQHNTIASICNAIDALLWLKSNTTPTFGNEITI